MNREKLVQKFMETVLENGEIPSSVYAFCKANKWKEADFYTHFSDLNDLQAAIWSDILKSYTDEMYEQEVFKNYGIREKILALFFGYIERLQGNRSYFILTMKPSKNTGNMLDKMKSLHRLRKTFLAVVEPFILEAKATEQIPDRKWIAGSYKELLWLNFAYVLYFWLNDTSPAFEQTDACIEKSVQLSMDLIERNTLDQVIDFGKFVFSHSMPK